MKCQSAKPFEVIIRIKHFDQQLCSSLQTVNSFEEAELIGLGMRTGIALVLKQVWGVEDLTSTTEEVNQPRMKCEKDSPCECCCHAGGFENGELCKQPCDKCDCPD